MKRNMWEKRFVAFLLSMTMIFSLCGTAVAEEIADNMPEEAATLGLPENPAPVSVEPAEDPAPVSEEESNTVNEAAEDTEEGTEPEDGEENGDAGPAEEARKELACQLVIHQHEEGCYDQDGALICGMADYVIHVHNEDCYDSAGELVCLLPQVEAHTHTEACYEKQEKLICTQEESEGHAHGDACYAAAEELTCGQEEREGHTHTDDCWETTQSLVCTLEESQGHSHSAECSQTVQGALCCDLEENEEHSHSDSCYAAEEELICGQEEREGHTHTDACYETAQNLICTLEEGQGHSHGAECYVHVGDLICGLEESQGHKHNENCYETQRVLTCEKAEIVPHIHTDACYDENGALTCGCLQTEEHIHSEACFLAVKPKVMLTAAGEIPKTGNISDLPGLGIYPSTLQEDGKWVVYDTGDVSRASVKAVITLQGGITATKDCYPFIRRVDEDEPRYPNLEELKKAVGEYNDMQCYMIHWVSLDEDQGTYNLETGMEVGNGREAEIQLEYLDDTARLAGEQGGRKLKIFSTQPTDGTTLKEISNAVTDVQLDVHNYKGFSFKVTEPCPYVFVSKKVEKGFVEKLAISSVKDGTAPFDLTNDAGNDNGENNGIIRSYDTIEYILDATFKARQSSIVQKK